MAKKNKSQDMAQSILDALKAGTAPWIKPWSADKNQAPHNPISGTKYKGINSLYLSLQGKEDPRWVTFNQAKKKGWQVKKGSKGTNVQYWQFEKDKKKIGDDGKKITTKIKLERPLLRHYYVFNAEAIEGMPELEKDPAVQNEWDRHERVENILKESGANIEHVKGDKASYSPLADKIKMPLKEQFDQPDKYYATALHELGHWTGHETRLERPFDGVFGSQEYAREELRAEIASYMLGMEMGVGHDPGQHLAYVDSWIKDLEDHPTEIYKACADAEKINTFVMAFELEQGQENFKEGNMKEDTSHYIVTDDSLTSLTTADKINGDAFLDETARFENPAVALIKALEQKEINAATLEGSELHIYKVNPGNDLEKNPVLSTGIPLKMKAMWEKNIGGEFPANILNDEIRSMPGMPESQENKLTGKRFISFFSTKEIDPTGNINLELQQALQRGTTIGVLRFENALEKDIKEKSKVNTKDLKKSGVDGIIFTENRKPVAAMATEEKSLHKGMFQAAKGQEKKYLAVPFAEKDQAKKHGALWSKAAKSWFIPEGLDSKPFQKWEIGKSAQTDNPQQQFADFIKEMGGNLQGGTPLMDGKIHRIAEEDGPKGNKNISYIGHLDGVPAGYVKNFRGGESKWKMTGVVLSNEDRARIQKEGAEKKAQREKEREQLYKVKAEESKKITDNLKPATGKEKYFVDKGIILKKPNVKVGQNKNSIVIPMKDIDGKQWSHQTMQTNGFKQIFKDSRLQGTFALIGASSVKDIKGDFSLVEGYSTGSVIHETTDKPVVVCSTSNNLKQVASILKERYPAKDIYIFADDDRYLTEQGKVNSGQVKAKEAATAVQGHVITPSFGKQKMDKTKTDFHDMARLRGKDEVRKYIKAKKALSNTKKIHEKSKQKEKELKQPSIER